MNKRGDMVDFIFFGLILFIIGVVIIFGSKLIGDFNTRYQDSGASAESKTIMSNNEGRFTGIFDGLFSLVFILMIIAVFISLFLLPSHPSFFFIMLIAFAFILIPIALLSNVFEDFTTTDSVATEAASFTFMGFIMQHWVIIMTVFGFIGLVLLYGKFQGAD